jgi:hypothetical protein
MRWFLGAMLLLALGGCGVPSAASATLAAPVAEAQAAPRLQRSPAPIPTPVPLPTPTATPSAVPATPTPAEPPLLPGEPAPVLGGELLLRTYSIDVYWTEGGLDPEAVKSLGAPLELALISDSLKIGGELAGRVAISFEPPQSGPCAIRGLTLSAERTIRMFYEPGSDPNRVLAILAHELFHQLQHDYYGAEPHLRSDVILLEGMAVWGSSPYFLDADGRPVYQRAAKQALEDGTLLPLTYSLEADCRTTSRVNIYNEWASFVEFLLATYGREPFDRLYVSSSGRPAGSSDYAGVYGKPLATLEAEWIAWLAAQP